MIHKTPLEIRFYNYDHRGKIRKPVARREMGAPTPVLARQTAAWRKPGSIYLGTTQTPCPHELSSFSSWPMFQILIILTKAVFTYIIRIRFLILKKT